MEKELENLYLHTIEAIQKGELRTIDENLIVFKGILELVLNKSENPKKSTILKDWNKYINLIGENLLSKDLLDNTRDLIISMYKIEDKFNIYKLNFEPIILGLLKKINNLNSSNKIVDISFLSILFAALLNIRNYGDYYDDNNVPHFYRIYYYNILKNNNLTEEEKNELIKGIIDEIFYLTAIEKVTKDKIKIRTAENVFLTLLKTMVDQNDVNRLKKLLNKISKNHYFIKELNISKIFIIISIYIYYLAFKENLPAHEKQMYQDLLSELNLNLEGLLQYENDIFFNFYEHINNELSKWERFLDDEDAKWLMMSSVVREFFLFYNAANIYYSPIKNQEIDENNLFQMINSLLTENKIEENTLENYRRFKRGFGYESEEIKDQQELYFLVEQLLAKYKQIQLNKVMDYAKKELVIKENGTTLLKMINESMHSNPLLKLISKEVNQDKRKLQIINQINPINYFVEIDTTKMFQEIIDRRFNDLIFNELFKKFKTHNIKFRETNKTRKILDVIYQTENEGLFKINSVLNGLSKNSGFFYTEEGTNLIQFNQILESIPNKEEARELILIGFDNRFNTYNLGDIRLDIRKLNDDEINRFLEKIKFNNNLYKINIVNDLALIFEEDEAREYISLGYRVLDIHLEIGLTIIANSGFIIKPGS